MAADTHSEAVPCPDPSAHEKSHKLSEQASTAALYVTHPERRVGDSRQSTEEVLGPDGKLSSKSAATSLKYAKATDLPSFPSTGNASGSAGKAAMLAKDYKMKELWQPEQSMAGSKAAVLAAGKGGKVDLWEAQATAAGQSAATLAFRNKGLSPQAYGGNSAEEKSKALRAATMSHHAGRQRAESTPAPPPALYPDAHNSGANALNAATVSHRASIKKSDGWDSAANQAARVKNIDMNKEMFTDHPGYQYEEDDHQAALKASAISMAKKMYESQNRSAMLQDPDGSDLAGARTAARSQAAAPDVKQEALQYISMQDAAHKLAAERLAKIDKSMENQRFREYYGYEDKPKRLSSRLSVRGRGRNRASSEGAGSFMDDSDDEETARKIRTQMANLSNGLSNVDAKKQQDDRAKLLAAAEKRVSSRMHDMDEKVYRDTGKVSQSMMDDWEAKAMEKAQKDRELQAQNPGKMHIGGGKFMEQSEIEAIAAARLKPTLDEINDTAEKRRERDIEMARERDEEQTRKMEEKMRKQAEKDEQKRIKAELKESSKREKEAEKSEQQRVKNELRESNKREKDEEKARKAETRKSHDQKRDTLPAAATGVAAGGVAAEELKHGHDDEPTEETGVTDGREKHRSALARLKDKFRKSGAPEEKEKVEPEAEKPVEEKTHDKTAIAGGAAAGAATGAALADIEHTHHDQSLDAQQATFAATQDEDRPTTATTGTTATTTVPAVTATEPQHEPVSPITPSERNVSAAAPEPAPFVTSAHDIAPVAATAPALPPVIAVGDKDADDEDDSLYEESQSARPSRPGFQQTGSFAGYHNDQAGTLGATHMPTLERHISQIPESESGSDSDDEDWNDERPSRGRTGVHEEPAGAVIGQPAVHSETQDHVVPHIGAAAAGASYVPLEERAVQQPPQQTSDANLGVGQRAFQEQQHAPVPVSAVTSATTTAPLAERVVHQPREQPTEANVGVGQQAFQQEQHVPATATTGVAAAPVVEPIAQQPLAQKSDANLGIGEREWKTETHTGAPVAAAAGGAGGAAVATTAAAAEPPHPSNEVYDETMTRTNEQRAEPPKDLPATLKTPGVPKDTDAASTVAIPPASAPGSPTDKHKRNESGVIAGAAGVGTAGAAAVGASEFSKKDAERKAEPTSPIKRDTEKSTEKPSEKDDKKGLRGFFSKMRHGSKSEKKQPGSFMAADKKEKEKEEKKSVPYDSTKPGDKPVVVANKSEAEKSPTSPTGTATSSTIPPVDVGPEFKASDQHIGTDGPIGDKEHVSGLHGNPAATEPESPSSFTRGEATGADPDDVSSSGVDEEDVKRGRGGRFARKLFGKPKDERDLLEKQDKGHGRGRASEDTSGRDARTSGVSTTEDENDQFEEARDHFDENLAPPPAFAGQKKSESPVRATRFHEEV